MGTYDPYDDLPRVPSFALTSDDISDGAELPVAHRSGIFGAGGHDISPHLSWSGFPAETKSFAVTCFDPDAPTASGFWHWAVFNIPATVTSLVGNAGNGEQGSLPASAVTLRNDAGLARYLGAAPPSGHGKHRYFFVVHALGADRLDVDADATCAFLGFNMFGATLARARLVPWYEARV